VASEEEVGLKGLQENARNLKKEVDDMKAALKIEDIKDIESESLRQDMLDADIASKRGQGIVMSVSNGMINRLVEEFNLETSQMNREKKLSRATDLYELNLKMNEFNLAAGRVDDAIASVQRSADTMFKYRQMAIDEMERTDRIDRLDAQELRQKAAYENQQEKDGYIKISPEKLEENIRKYGEDRIRTDIYGDSYLRPAVETAGKEQFTLSSGQIRYDGDGNVIAIGSGIGDVETKTIGNKIVAINPDGSTRVIFEGESPETVAENFSETMKFRNSYLSQSKEFKDVQNSYNRIKASAEKVTPAGDLSLIFNYMKMLDPSSVVREGEFATAQNTTGIPEKIKNIYNSFATGQRLGFEDSKQRKDFVDTAKRLFDKQKNTQLNIMKESRTTAGALGLNPMLSVPDLIEMQPTFETFDNFLDNATDAQLEAANAIQQETGATDEELLDLVNEQLAESISFNNVGSDTNLATLKEVVTEKDGEKGGQCGRFVNKITGLGVGDSYESKIAKMDPSITTPEPGMVFTMPYKDTGHTGFIVGIDGDDAVVKDSNWFVKSSPETIKTHKIPLKKMTGFARV